MSDDDIVWTQPEAGRTVDVNTFAELNAHAGEHGRTGINQAGIDVLDPEKELYGLPAFILGELGEVEDHGGQRVPNDAWIVVAWVCLERDDRLAGRIIEVRAAAYFGLQPAAIPADYAELLIGAADAYAAKRERLGLPLGRSFF